MKTIAIIPARTGTIAGSPCYKWTAGAALACAKIDAVFIAWSDREPEPDDRYTFVRCPAENLPITVCDAVLEHPDTAAVTNFVYLDPWTQFVKVPLLTEFVDYHTSSGSAQTFAVEPSQQLIENLVCISPGPHHIGVKRPNRCFFVTPYMSAHQARVYKLNPESFYPTSGFGVFHMPADEQWIDLRNPDDWDAVNQVGKEVLQQNAVQ